MIRLRIGAVNREDRPITARQFSVWCSRRDVAQMVERCISAPGDLRFDVFYVVSNAWSYRDLTHARAVVGYEPLDRAENYGPGPHRPQSADLPAGPTVERLVAADWSLCLLSCRPGGSPLQ